MATISLRCKACDGILEVDEDREIVFCPYCGSKELVLESDEVKKERIKYKTYKDVEIERFHTDRAMADDKARNERKEEQESRKTFLVYIVCTLAIMIVYVLLTK